jgi:hypothetical protein
MQVRRLVLDREGQQFCDIHVHSTMTGAPMLPEAPARRSRRPAGSRIER